jgi:hypothetical protein
MFDQREEISSKPFHDDAQVLSLSYIGRFATLLMWQAKVVATRERAEVVLSTHVDEALGSIVKERGRSRRRDFAIALGGALFGCGFMGFVNEAAMSEMSAPWLSLFGVTCVTGVALLFWALGWRRWPPQHFPRKAGV